jgi:hypothetical protein
MSLIALGKSSLIAIARPKATDLIRFSWQDRTRQATRLNSQLTVFIELLGAVSLTALCLTEIKLIGKKPLPINSSKQVKTLWVV